MGFGRFVSVRTTSSRGERVTVAYVVAEQDADRAIKIIGSRIAKLTDDVIEVCRVSEELVNALGLSPGEFRRADGRPF